MSTKILATPYITVKSLIKSHRKEYRIGVKLLDNVLIEITQRFYDRKKAIEEMEKVINLLNGFNIKVKWGVLNEKIKNASKDGAEAKTKAEKKKAFSSKKYQDTGQKKGSFRGAAR